MAGAWIKMRGGLFNSPKLIAMSRILQQDRQFRDWLCPGSGSMKDRTVSDHASRCVTGALLCVTWSWSREFGKCLENDDCLLEQITIEDIDGIAGAPGVGLAMASVGWAIEAPSTQGVILPKFFSEHNIPPMTDAERAKAYRARKREMEHDDSGEVASRNRHETSVISPLPQKRRAEQSKQQIASSEAICCEEQQQSPLTPPKGASLGDNPQTPEARLERLSGSPWSIDPATLDAEGSRILHDVLSHPANDRFWDVVQIRQPNAKNPKHRLKYLLAAMNGDTPKHKDNQGTWPMAVSAMQPDTAMNCQQFREIWQQWDAVHSEVGRALVPTEIKCQIEALDRMELPDAIEVLHHNIRSGNARYGRFSATISKTASTAKSKATVIAMTPPGWTPMKPEEYKGSRFDNPPPRLPTEPEPEAQQTANMVLAAIDEAPDELEAKR